MKTPPSTSDAELILAFQRGEASAFDRLLERYQTSLYTFLLRMVKERVVAEDLFQETFLRVLRALPTYEEKGRFSSWLFGIGHRLCIDNFRRRRLEQTVYDANAETSDLAVSSSDSAFDLDQLEKEELWACIDDAVASLPMASREVFLLRQHGEITFREIAHMLDRPLNTVLGQMRQAIRLIRLYLEKQYV
jgi:RNA polymerase sigma-70 factor (ECF subfamily)